MFRNKGCFETWGLFRNMGGWYGVVFCVVSCMRPTVYNAPTLFILYRVVEANSITLALGEGGGRGGGEGSPST